MSVDPWQSGKIEVHFTTDEIDGWDDPLDAVMTNWAMRDPGGIHKNGTINAPTIAQGKKTVWYCQGLLVCSGTDDPLCTKSRLRPHTKNDLVAAQVENYRCRICKSQFVQVRCKVKQIITRYAGGLLYECTGTHHDRASSLTGAVAIRTPSASVYKHCRGTVYLM